LECWANFQFGESVRDSQPLQRNLNAKTGNFEETILLRIAICLFPILYFPDSADSRQRDTNTEMALESPQTVLKQKNI
jgi:hypothetical protein